MKAKEIQNTIDRYNERLKQFGISEKALGWGDKGRSKLRFEILCSEWDIENKTILDYGCGFGDLYQYIKDTRTDNFKYIGVDINNNFVEIGKSRNYPNAEFYLVSGNAGEVLAPFENKIDYIVSSGIFNFKLEDNITYIKQTLDLFNKYAVSGFAANFLSDRVDFKAESNYHSNPGQILNLVYEYGNNVILRNDYMPYEFTVFFNKNKEIDKELNVYSEFIKFI
jgi:hypothetical protein